MALIRKYSYLRALVIGVPFGIACIIVGLKQFINIPDSVAKFCLYQGEITYYGMKSIYDRDAEANFNVFYIEIEDKLYYTELGSNIDVLNSKLPAIHKKSKDAKVWYKKDSFYIEQLLIGDRLLIVYKPPYWIGHFFLWLGVVTLASALIYVIKHPEDLTGKKKK
jgi:hypothetical protein